MRARLVKAGAGAVVAGGAVAPEEHEAAVAAAYEAGLAAGRAAGRGEAATEARAAAGSVADAVVAAFAGHRAAVLADVGGTTEELLAAAVEVARWVIGRDLTADSTSLLERLGDATVRMVAPGELVVTVSPRDVPLVTEWAAGRARVVGDPRLRPGEARVASETSEAVVTIAAAIRRAQEALGIAGTDALSGPAVA